MIINVKEAINATVQNGIVVEEPVHHPVDLSFLQKERLHTGFGQDISSATSSAEALQMAGMNWRVEPRPMYYLSDAGILTSIPNQFQNVRTEDGKPLGAVSGRYQIVQNEDAFQFTDELLGSGLTFDRGGSFRGGKSVWLSAKMPEDKIILGDPVEQSLVFVNTHDGTGSVKIMIAPMRIVCSNALNLFTRRASRKWSCVHTGRIDAKLEEARETLLRVDQYMAELEQTCEELQALQITESDVLELTEKLFPLPKEPTDRQMRNILENREGLKHVYFEKEDLLDFGNTAYRFVSAVSDYATHAAPQRATRSYNERLYERTINGHSLIDQAERFFIKAHAA